MCTADGRPVPTSIGFRITPHTDLDPLAGADLVAVPARPLHDQAPAEALDALPAAIAPGGCSPTPSAPLIAMS